MKHGSSVSKTDVDHAVQSTLEFARREFEKDHARLGLPPWPWDHDDPSMDAEFREWLSGLARHSTLEPARAALRAASKDGPHFSYAAERPDEVIITNSVLALALPDLTGQYHSDRRIIEAVRDLLGGVIEEVTALVVAGVRVAAAQEINGCEVLPLTDTIRRLLWLPGDEGRPWNSFSEAGECLVVRRRRLSGDQLRHGPDSSDLLNVAHAIRVTCRPDLLVLGYVVGGTVFSPAVLAINSPAMISSWKHFLPRAIVQGDVELTSDCAAMANAIARALAEAAPEVHAGLRRLDLASGRELPEDRLVDLCIALESFLLREENESDGIGYRLSMRGARLVCASEDRLCCQSLIKSAYGLRSKVVHGERLHGKKGDKARRSIPGELRPMFALTASVARARCMAARHSSGYTDVLGRLDAALLGDPEASLLVDKLQSEFALYRPPSEDALQPD